MMILQQTRIFKNTTKKLHSNQKYDLDAAIQGIIKDPLIGHLKKGDLTNVRVYKFKMSKQLTLLAYMNIDSSNIIILLALGTHENFYNQLKRK